jgi:hypothetical protein
MGTTIMVEENLCNCEVLVNPGLLKIEKRAVGCVGVEKRPLQKMWWQLLSARIKWNMSQQA